MAVSARTLLCRLHRTGSEQLISDSVVVDVVDIAVDVAVAMRDVTGVL